MPAYTEEYMLAGIREGGKKMEEVMAYLYLHHSCREEIFSFILTRKGTREEAEDIFQDAISVLTTNIRSGNYNGRGTLTAYLFGISRNLWYKRFQKIRQQDLFSVIPENEADEETPEFIMIEKDREARLEELMDQLGPACRKVLEMWKLNYSMREIAIELGYKNEAVARKKKRLCMKKLLEILDEQPHWKAWLK